ncbi:MAG: hypothetical protein R3Y65_01900 [Bacillota bacterium]
MKIGIFWQLEEGIFAKTCEACDCKQSPKTSRIDSDFVHYIVWDELQISKFPSCKYADFVTFPRGRVMFDIAKNQHIIFADKCITSEQIEKIAKHFEIESYTLERDVHYSCDKCVDLDKLFN